MPDEINNAGEDFDLNFAQGGSYDETKEVTPSFEHDDAVDIVFSDYDPLEAASYLEDNADNESVLRVTFDMTAGSGSLYRNARFGILEDQNDVVRSFVGVYETITEGTVTLINIALDGQTLGALAKTINEYSVAKAEVLNNRYDLSSDCLVTSPLQNGTNVWSLFFRAEDCGQDEQTVISTLKEDIKFYYTSAEPELAQNTPSQSLGGFVSPTQLYNCSRLSQAISFTDTYLMFDNDNLVDYTTLQINDELVTVKEWRESVAVIEERHAYGTPIRFHPAGSMVRGVGKNDIFNRVFNVDRKQYRCIAVRNTSLEEIARNVKVFFKLASRNMLSRTRFAIEIPSSEYRIGTATGGTVSSLTDSSLADLYSDGHFVGAPLTMTSGSSAGQTRLVIGYNGVTGEFSLDSELPSKPSSGNTYKVDTAPSQTVASGIFSPVLISTNTTEKPHLISAFTEATFGTEGVSINISGNRTSGMDLLPNETVYLWLEREIDDNNDEFSNNRAIVTVSFSRA